MPVNQDGLYPNLQDMKALRKEAVSSSGTYPNRTGIFICSEASPLCSAAVYEQGVAPKMVLLARWTRGPERPIITNPAADGVATGL